MNAQSRAQSRCFWTIISDCYTRTGLHFLTIWVTALTVWPDYQLSALQIFLSDKDGMALKTTYAAYIVIGQNAFSAFFGIVGAMVLDGYLTHYGMIFGSSFFYSASFRKPIEERCAPLICLIRVYMATFKKRNLPSPRRNYALFEGNPEHPLEPTSAKRFLGKAAIKDTSGLEGRTEVEECKRLLHMVPICMAFLSYGLIYSIGDTLFLEQTSEDTEIPAETTIPGQVFLLIASLSKVACKQLYKEFIWKRLRGSAKTYAPAIQYAMGMVLSTLCCAVASWVAMERRASSSKRNVFLLSPQFIVFGAMHGLAGDSIQEFFSAELPGSIKHYDTVFSDGIVGAGTVCAILLILVTSQWFEGKTTRWDRFYHLCTVIGISIFFYYSFAAVGYYCQDNQEIQVEDESEQEEGGADSAEHVIDIPPASQGETEEAPKAKLRPAISFKTSARAAVFLGKAQQITNKNRGFNPAKEN